MSLLLAVALLAAVLAAATLRPFGLPENVLRWAVVLLGLAVGIALLLT